VKKIRVYVDTSVIGGCLDPEFETWSRGMLLDFQKGFFMLLLSSLTEAEIQDAPYEVKEIYKEFRNCDHEFIELNVESIELADAYLKRKIIPVSFRNDAQHISMATASGADILVSWNFKHIVNFEKVRRFNAVNLDMGYKPIAIYSPREVTTHGRESS
jgi:predicted nucleic acid-binding protein